MSNSQTKASAPTLPAPAIDLERLSDEELVKLSQDATQELATRKAKRVADFRTQIEQTATVLGLPVARLLAAFPKIAGERARPRSRNDGRSTVKPKFRNPKNPSQTWAGRGAAPKWFTDHMTAGGKEDELRIPDPEGTA